MKNFVYPEFLNGMIRGDFDFDRDSFKIVLMKPDLLESDLDKAENSTYEAIKQWECKGADNMNAPYATGGADIAFTLETTDKSCRLVLKENSSKNSIVKLGGVEDHIRWAFVYRNGTKEPEVTIPPKAEPEQNVPEVASVPEEDSHALLMCFDLASGASGIQATGANVDLNFNDFAIEIRNA